MVDMCHYAFDKTIAYKNIAYIPYKNIVYQKMSLSVNYGL